MRSALFWTWLIGVGCLASACSPAGSGGSSSPAPAPAPAQETAGGDSDGTDTADGTDSANDTDTSTVTTTTTDTGTNTNTSTASNTDTGTDTGNQTTVVPGEPTLAIVSVPAYGVNGASAIFSYKVHAPALNTVTGLDVIVDAPYTVATSACDADLEPGENCAFSVAVACSASATKTAVLTISYAHEGEAKALVRNLSVPCVAPAALTIDSPSQAGTTAFGSTRDVTFEITNTGGAPATTVALSGLTAPFAIHSETCPSELAPAASCDVTVRFTAAGIGDFDDTLVVDYHDGVAAQQATRDQEGDGVAAAVTVERTYGMGDYWMAPLSITDPSKEHWDQAAIWNSNYQTINMGEFHKVVTTRLTSCADLAFADSLDAFRWVCRTTTTGVTFYSIGLKPLKGLKDLVDSSPAWIPIGFEVEKDGDTILEATPSVWFDNDVVAMPDSSSAVASLGTAGAVYVVASSMSSVGVHLNAHQISVVTLPGAKLSYSGNTANCTNTGNVGATNKCLLFGNAKHWIYVEGDFDAASVTSGNGYGFYLGGNSEDAIVRNANFSHFRSTAVAPGNKGALIYNVRVAHGSSATAVGIGIGGDYHTVHNVHVSGLNKGLVVSGCSPGTVALSSVYATANATGIQVSCDANLSHVTTANNSTVGIDLSTSNAFVAALSSANDVVGLRSNGAPTVHHAALMASGTEVDLLASADIKVHGFLLGDSSFACAVASGGEGLDDGTCTTTGTVGSNTYSNGASTAMLIPDNVVSQVYAPITSGDAQNASDDALGGRAIYESITDWLHFETYNDGLHMYRSWGKYFTTGMPEPTGHGACDTAGTLCGIWDYGARTGQLVTGAAGLGVGGTYTVGEPCPNALSGNQVFATNKLLHAIEIFFDGKGDEDGLCESNEACIYARNYGAHQGTSTLPTATTCTFQNGTVANVSMHALPY